MNIHMNETVTSFVEWADDHGVSDLLARIIYDGLSAETEDPTAPHGLVDQRNRSTMIKRIWNVLSAIEPSNKFEVRFLNAYDPTFISGDRNPLLLIERVTADGMVDAMVTSIELVREDEGDLGLFLPTRTRKTPARILYAEGAQIVTVRVLEPPQG